MNLSFFPPLNASLNGASALFLLTAYGLVKSRRYAAHATMMIAAFVTSSAFLACYLTYHYLRPHAITPFPPGPWRPLYLAILISHSILAAVIVPMVLITLWRASRRRWPRHRALAVWTFPLWLYVSVTGVVIYWMLYHLAPTLHS